MKGGKSFSKKPARPCYDNRKLQNYGKKTSINDKASK